MSSLDVGHIFSQSFARTERESPRIYDSSKFPFYQAELYHQFHEPDTSKKQRAQRAGDFPSQVPRQSQ